MFGLYKTAVCNGEGCCLWNESNPPLEYVILALVKIGFSKTYLRNNLFCCVESKILCAMYLACFLTYIDKEIQ
jgi:hypothetical protein